MATYDVTGPSNAGARPGRFSAGIRTPYLVENTIDISAVNSDAGTADGDILQCIDIPAETLILHAGVEVLTALSSSATIDLGVTGADPDRYVDGDTNATGYSTLTATARMVSASADTLDALIAGAASSAGKIRVFALLCDVSGVDETDRNTDAQHDG
jgi:hypothetical protein